MCIEPVYQGSDSLESSYSQIQGPHMTYNRVLCDAIHWTENARVHICFCRAWRDLRDRYHGFANVFGLGKRSSQFEQMLQ